MVRFLDPGLSLDVENLMVAQSLLDSVRHALARWIALDIV
jgi:hypothetical protein